jgi:hypothetical protein
MAADILNVKTCVKCGSTERNSNGDCRPCQIECSRKWKEKHKAEVLASGEPLFYTYIHRRASDGKVFYVGKGKDDRAESHKNRNNHWLKTVKKHGIRVEIVARWFDEKDAFEYEKELIAQHREFGLKLCNYTDGGDGISGHRHSDETRAKLSLVQIGKVISAETRAKLSLANKGRPRTDEVKAKISASNTGKKRTTEQNQRNSERSLGKILSAEHIAKISAANMGRKVSVETRFKISSAGAGKEISAEHRAKISAGNKGRVSSDEFKAKIAAALTGRPCSEETRAKISAKNKGKTVSAKQRKSISETLKGRKPSPETLQKLIAIANSPEKRAQHSAAMKGRPWSESRRLAHQQKTVRQ